MPEPVSMMSDGGKVPPNYRYFNLATLWIPYYRRAAHWFYRVGVPHELLTGMSIAFGIFAFLFILVGEPWMTLLIAAVLLHLKDLFDATDGTVARLTASGHPIGRYLDTLGDFLVLSLISLAFLIWLIRLDSGLAGWMIPAWIFTLVLGSYWNHYNQRYLAIHNPEAQSASHQDAYDPSAEDAAYTERWKLALLQVLRAGYHIVFSWQDLLMKRLDAWSQDFVKLDDASDELKTRWVSERFFLTAQSAFCYGLPLALMALSTLLQAPGLFAVLLGIVFPVFALLLHGFRLFWMRRLVQAESPQQKPQQTED